MSKPNRIQGMVRSIDQYRNMNAKVVASGSIAQIEYALIDALHDISVMWWKLEDLAKQERLISAAPELLDALKQIADNGDGTGRNPQLMVNTALAAIAKATGE